MFPRRPRATTRDMGAGTDKEGPPAAPPTPPAPVASLPPANAGELLQRPPEAEPVQVRDICPSSVGQEVPAAAAAAAPKGREPVVDLITDGPPPLSS
mmetsp:Transcript_9003/g.22314  ORF Transcript_9003/g.22314 Transcript_9003/m.22314 type:complete len:97 (-) Transcript_9003:827-1117(-)